MQEYNKHEEKEIICIGEKAVDLIKGETDLTDVVCFKEMENIGVYDTAVQVKDYLVES